MTAARPRVIVAAAGGVGTVGPDRRWQFEGVRYDGVLALTADRLGPRVYAVSSRDGGLVHGMELAEPGSARDLGTRSSAGEVPCSVALSPDGSALLVANYADGSVSVIGLDADGRLGELRQRLAYQGSGPVPERQTAAHVHQVLVAPDGELVLVTDLGADRVYSYRWDRGAARLEVLAPPARVPPGSGPRHLVFHPDGGLLGVDELSSAVSRYDVDRRTGQVHWRERVLIGRSADGANYPSEIALSPDGRFAYVGNRGADTISVIQVTPAALTEVEQVPAGAWPQHLALIGDRLWCACMRGDEVVSWQVDRVSGRLTDRSVEVAVPTPTWVLATYPGA